MRRRRPEPEIVVQSRRHRRVFLDEEHFVRAARAPDMHAANRPEDAGLHEFDDPAIVVTRIVNLRAHLRDDALPGRRLHHHAHLVHRMGQRLLAVDVLAGTHRQDRGRRMMMIGRRDQHRLDVLLLVDHLAIIVVIGRPGMRLLLRLLCGDRPRRTAPQSRRVRCRRPGRGSIRPGPRRRRRRPARARSAAVAPPRPDGQNTTWSPPQPTSARSAGGSCVASSQISQRGHSAGFVSIPTIQRSSYRAG